jgi:hypothetical protein
MTCFQGWNVKNLQTLRHSPQILAQTRPQPRPNQSNLPINNNKPKFPSDTPQTQSQADPQNQTGNPQGHSKPSFGFLVKRNQQNPTTPPQTDPNTTTPVDVPQQEEVPKKKPAFAFIKKPQSGAQEPNAANGSPAPQGQLNQSEVFHTDNGNTPNDGNLNRTQETPKKKPAFGFIKKKTAVTSPEPMESGEQQKSGEILETEAGIGLENPQSMNLLDFGENDINYSNVKVGSGNVL